jgi:excinuclease ABC subunit C
LIDEVKTERIEQWKIKLSDKAKSLPTKPGCYLMKNSSSEIIYVGKAKSLRNRVSSYFSNAQKNGKTEILISHIREFDFVLTQTDAEAFVLENTLIKKHIPKYNIRLKDDKSYPYVVIDHNEKFPRIQYKRKLKKKKRIEIFGPFVHGSNISEVIRIVTKAFKLRDCSLREFKSRKEPCLLFQMKQCDAPCVNKISFENYEVEMNCALDVFRGKGRKSLRALEKRMLLYAEKEDFEQAAMVRDYIETLNSFISFSKQENAQMHTGQKNVDLVSYHQGDIEIDLSIYIIRNGIMLGHKNFHFPNQYIGESLEEEICAYLFQYYTESFDTYPEHLILPFKDSVFKTMKDAMENLEQAILVKSPGKRFKSLMDLATSQAFESQRVRLSNQESIYVGLNKLKDLLKLKERPIVLECYDIAIWQGASPAASQIVFIEGKAEKTRYRHYKMQELPEGNNDFAMMSELISRRIKHGALPDVFIVDGGKGQISSFQAVLEEQEVEIPVVGIAKSKSGKNQNFSDKDVYKSEERLFIPGRVNPYYLRKNMSLYRIIVQMRDEAHRFSRRLHHKNEKSRTFHSWLDEVAGIGQKTKQKVLSKSDLTLDELAELSEVELMNKFSINQKIAKNIKKYLEDRS